MLFIIPDVYQDDNYFPLGPAYMAAVLKKNGVEVSIYCQDVFHYTNEELAEFLEKNDFDLICVGFISARFRRTIEPLCAVINKHKKNAWLVLGGVGASPMPEYVLEKTKADIVAIGEAEETIVEILKYKLEGKDPSQIKSIAYRGKDGIAINERRRPIIDLDSIPFPEWSLFPMKRYISCLTLFGADKDDKTLGILTSRGCFNRCNFCYRMEKSIRFRSVANVVEEIKILRKRYGVSFFQMQDELFNFPKKRIFEFYEELKKEGLKIKYSCNARVDVFDAEVAACLKDSGCKFLNFGLESADQNVLNLMKKNATVEQNVKAVETAKKVGIGVGLNFLWGNKGDSADSLRKNVEFIKKYNTYDQIRTMKPPTPYPGCELYYEAIKSGLLSGPDDFFNKFKNSELLTVNFTDMPKDDFYKLLFEANKELIVDHFQHTTKDMASAEKLIQDFYSVYFEGKIAFSGPRHYDKKN